MTQYVRDDIVIQGIVADRGLFSSSGIKVKIIPVEKWMEYENNPLEEHYCCILSDNSIRVSTKARYDIVEVDYVGKENLPENWNEIKNQNP